MPLEAPVTRTVRGVGVGMGGNEDDAGRFEKGIRWKWRQLDPTMGKTLLDLLGSA
jgi:hypothetical protein